MVFVPLSAKTHKELGYAEVIVYLIAAELIATLWQRAFENFIFGTLGYSDKSTWLSWVISLAVTSIVLLLVFNYTLITKGLLVQ